MDNREAVKTGFTRTGTLIWAVVIAFFLGFFSGILLTIYKTTGGIPVSTHTHSEHDRAPDFSEQIAALEQETTSNPDNTESWIQLGDLYFDSDLYEKAILAYEKALAIHPENADVWTNLGVIYRKTGQFEKAIDCFDKATDIDPKHEISRYNKGVVLMHDLNDLKGAISSWEGLLEINPLAMGTNGLSIEEMLKKFKQ